MYATCATEECSNAYLPVAIPDDVGTVMCGPCGFEVTNITEIRPDEGKELPEWISEMLTRPNSAS